MIARFVGRYLDPSETLLEILFGLIMALTITTGARLLSERADIVGVELALALLGCNLAWGVIDGAFYLLGTIFNRNRRVQFVRRLQTAASDVEALAAIKDEFALDGEPPMRPQDKAHLHRTLLDLFRHAGTDRAHLRGHDWVAAGLIVVLVSATAIPGLIPLLVFDDGFVALRWANALQVGLLFLTGYWWAHYSGSSRWRTGLAIALLGSVLVLLAVPLGG
ncbi:VIT1/CCC1 transporter family protein [Reyranella sp.]|uniref:VIT1/CCC1 transporter family protein n=1 Tax=Reyranella sp. TaxID=1929291 RepID=UPI003BA86EF8